jgi:hypothetical protein
MRRNFTRLLETPTLFGGGNATVPKCAAVVCCRLNAPAIDALVRAGQHRRSEGTHRLLAARLAGSQRPKPECCPCRSAPNHHTKPCHHSGQGPDGNVVCRSVPRVARLYLIGGQLVYKFVPAAGRNNQQRYRATNAVFKNLASFNDLTFSRT